MTPLQLVQAINAILITLNQMGVSWTKLSQRVARARAEGRPFGLSDLEAMRNDARAALDRLDAAIEAAKAKP